MPKTNLLGEWGETVAASFLKKKGYRILCCNYHSRFGEIDLIAQKKHFVVFVEVKLRKNDNIVEAREYVGSAKQHRVIATAEVWLSENDVSLQPRFDVIEVYAPQGMLTKKPEIIHWEDAFQ